jgi:uncharacterized phiE125 gp8 family phage protein
MGYKVITAVAGDVIPLADMRQHLKLDIIGGSTHPDDAMVQALLAAAREYCEHYTQRSIGAQTLELALDSFPSNPPGIELPLGAATLTSIKYVDTALVEQTISNTLYTLDDYSDKHWAIPASVWPTPADVANAVKVRYVTPAAIPAAGRAALLLLVSHLYQNREAVNLERGVVPADVPFGVKALLDTFRKWSL